MNKPLLDRIRAFGMTGFQIRDDIQKVEKSTSYELLPRSKTKVTREIEGYDQFSLKLRQDAHEMSQFYEIFFCLENTIRGLVSDILKDENGSDWWNTDCVKQHIQSEVSGRQKKELDSGYSARSEREIDYTTFGELSQLITDNWDQFTTVFNSKPGVSRVMNELNVLRGPIAHCCNISPFEKDRISLVVRNWLRLVA